MPRLSVFALLACLALPAGAAPPRIVALGGAVTEILFALGAGAQLVAVDSTSTYPAAADALPDVGYLRTLSAEPILALAPDLIIHDQDAGPPATLEQLRAAGVRLVRIDNEHSAEGAERKIREVALAIAREADGNALIAALRADLARVNVPTAEARRSRVLFVMQFDAGSVLAAGSDTAADAIIRLAGGDNVGAGFSGYKAISGEAVLAGAPDVVLTMDRALAGFAAPADALALASLRLTPAARHGRLVVMDGLTLLGFGPRLGQAVAQLAAALHPAP